MFKATELFKATENNDVPVTDLNAVITQLKDLGNQNEFLKAELAKVTESNTIPITQAKIVHDEDASPRGPQLSENNTSIIPKPVFVLVF